MALVEQKTLIKTTLEKASDYVVQPANKPNWIGSILEVTNISEGLLGVGIT